MRIAALMTSMLAAVLLTACGPGNKEGTGTVVGAVAGGLIGNQIGGGSGRVAATVGGAVLGGIIGSEIGRNMDEEDRRRAMAAEYRAFEYGRPGYPVAWDNPQTHYRGSVAVGDYYDRGGYRCRPYTHTIYIDGRPQVAQGTACRNPDGTWRTMG